MAKKIPKTPEVAPDTEEEETGDAPPLDPLPALASIIETHGLTSSYYVGTALGHLLAFGRTDDEDDLRRARWLINRQLAALGASDADE